MYTRKEELWNSVSHGIGILLGIAALVILLLFDTEKTTYSTFAVTVYAITLISLYTASTLYHAIPNPRWKPLLRKIDHISIYYLIAGTYTPVTLISLEAYSGWLLFWLVWAIAATGTLLKIYFTGRFEALSLILYLIMGWLIILDIHSVIEVHSIPGLWLLSAGGICYTFGILFYVIEKIPYNHAIWHFFVLAGSIFHFFFIFLDVI